MALTPYPSLATIPEIVANGLKIPASYLPTGGGSGNVVYASTAASAVADCNLFTGLTASGGTPTDNAAALNAVLATATANAPVHLILDGGFAIGYPGLLIPATGHVTISGQGWSTGLYVLPGSNATPITNFAGTDLARNQEWFPGGGPTANRGSNVTLANFRIHCNRGTYPNGNCNGGVDGTNGAAFAPDARSSQNDKYLLTGPWFVGLDNLTIEDLWIYDAPTFHVNLSACTKVKIRGCRIEAATPSFTGNTDGIHCNGGCSEVAITDCWLSTGDDAIGINLEEGNGEPGSDFLIDNIFLHGCLNAGRLYGLAFGTSQRVSITNVRGTVRNAGFNIGYEGGGVSASEANHSVYFGNVELAFIADDDNRKAIVWINSSAGNIDVVDCGFVSPTIAAPIVKMNDNAQIVASLRIINPRIHRSPTGGAACWIFEGTVGTVGRLEIRGASVTESVGSTYDDIVNLVNLNGTTVFDSLSFSGYLEGVGTAINVTSSSSVGAIDIPDLVHQANTGTDAAHSVVVANSTPVNAGRYRLVNCAGLTSGPATLTALARLDSPTFTGKVTSPVRVTTPHADTDGATITLDFSLSDFHTVTLGGSRTLAFANATAGQVVRIELIQDGTGSRLVTWPTVRWPSATAPTLATAAAKADLVAIAVRADGTYAGALSIPNY